MNVSSLLSESKPHDDPRRVQSGTHTGEPHTSTAMGHQGDSPEDRPFDQVYSVGSSATHNTNIMRAHSRTNSSVGLSNLPPKQVTFEYLLTEGNQSRARLPMRVKVNPHDTPEDIVVTVKHFYGLYDNYSGVSFEDRHGNTMIATYDNFDDHMVVYVRVFEDNSATTGNARLSLSPKRPRLAPPFELTQPLSQGATIPRPSSRTARNRSHSPAHMRGQRSQSASTNKSRPRMNIKVRNGSTQGSITDAHGDHDMSDSDGGNASVTSSRRGKADVVASAEISVENIVEGGRRKRARFDSSELPLFQPGQMATSISSLSPQRRFGSQPSASPFQYANQHMVSWSNTLPSPQSYNPGEAYPAAGLPFSQPTYPQKSRQTRATQQIPGRQAYYGPSHGVLPTPDPTIGSVISDEDVARQLMALGDPSNFSHFTGRTSTSTVDDAFSGKAELASSAEGSDGSDNEDDLPNGAVYTSSEEDCEDHNDTSFKGESDGLVLEDHIHKEGITFASPFDQSAYLKASKPHKAHSNSNVPKKVKSIPGAGKAAPMSPMSLPSQSRKASNASIQQFQPPLGVDEEDLSAKPRCQRCRKSKKGCDRQRPCGRCKDAGIGIEGCVSEDEGNGRKGRYGRHMGVTIKKLGNEDSPVDGLPTMMSHQVSVGLMAAPNFFPDKNAKKRKR